MRVEILASRPTEAPRGDSDLVVLAKAFADMGKKDKGDDSMWMTLMTMQQNHSKEMMELLSRRGGDAQMDRINSAWTTLFEGAKKMADVNKPNETADIAKALAPLGVAWLTGQQQMQMKQMELKAAAQGTQKQQPAQQQAPAPAAAEPAADPNAKRLAHKAEVFDAQMGMILHRASSGADPSAIGDELALAVRTVIYQELAEGHDQHQKMIKMLLEDPLASVTELAKATGRDEAYAKTVADRFMAKFRELMSQPQPNATPPQPQTVAAAPAPAPVVPPTPAQASAAEQPGPVASPAAGPGSVASGDGKPEGAEAAVVAKGNGSPHHGDADGGGQAAGGVDGAEHPDVSGQPS
jgi:hypothetical protein